MCSVPLKTIELKDTIKRETLQAEKDYIRQSTWWTGGLVSEDLFVSIKESPATKHRRKHEQCKSLSCRSRALSRRDIEYIRGVVEVDEGRLVVIDIGPTYQNLKELGSISASHVRALR